MRPTEEGARRRPRSLVLISLVILVTSCARSHAPGVPSPDAAGIDAAVVDAMVADAAVAPPDGSLNDCVGAVYFEDPTLESGVRDALGLEPSRPINAAEMLLLKDLRIQAGESNEQVASLLGIECATNLDYLLVYVGGTVSDLSPLSTLDLKAVFLPDQDITSVEVLGEMDRLVNLDLSGNEITDIRPLTSQVSARLRGWNLSDNDIVDVSSLLNLEYYCSVIDVSNNPLDNRSVTEVLPEICERVSEGDGTIRWSGGGCPGAGGCIPSG